MSFPFEMPSTGTLILGIILVVVFLITGIVAAGSGNKQADKD